ncbi:MAG: LysR family transcriptional regulator [Alphaproteobacteria bacterium]|nr:LysR family transcriptional regulator [Alphaproteobacteria bacterium]
MAKITTKKTAKPVPATRLRVVLAPGVFLGPGKGELLERIADTGSISAAGRAMGMSYKRAWMLVETLNGYFRSPLVTAATGGKAGGGAQLTPLGRQVLAQYQAMTQATETACKKQVAALHRLRKK